MVPPVGFAEILVAAEQLEAAAQAELIAILSRRLAERVIAPSLARANTLRMRSPRLARRGDAQYFVKDVTEEPLDAGL